LSFGAVHLAIHPCGKPQGILAKVNKRQGLKPLLFTNSGDCVENEGLTVFTFYFYRVERFDPISE
jgi:hypothetical protein